MEKSGAEDLVSGKDHKMYWVCLTKEELEMCIYYLESPSLPTKERTELVEKLEFYREHENQEYSERAPWQFTATFTGDSDLPMGPWESFKRALEKRKRNG